MTKKEADEMFSNLTCIECGAAGCVNLHLEDFARFNCTSCGGDYTQESVLEMFNLWQAVFKFTTPVGQVTTADPETIDS